MDIGLIFFEWFLSMSIGQRILFILGFFITMAIANFLIKGIEWVFYPYKKSHVGRKYFWLH